MKTFNNTETAFAQAQAVANRTGDLVCVMARDTRSQPEPWGVCSDADATMHINAWWSPWSHWADVRPTESDHHGFKTPDAPPDPGKLRSNRT